jgi:opacity protein-like surface antigen
MRTKLVRAFVWIPIAVATDSAQKVELSAFIGGQTNGGLDLSTAVFQRINVQNGMNYGLGAGYLLGERTGIELLWNYNEADTWLNPAWEGPIKLSSPWTPTSTWVIFCFTFPRVKKTRPFVLMGLGATNLHAASSDVGSITRFAWTLGGGRNTTSVNGWELVSRLSGHPRTSPHHWGLLVRPVLGRMLGRWEQPLSE